MPIIFFSYGLFYKQKFLNTKIKDNPYLIRVIGANISLDRFYKDTKPDTVINELIDLSSPNQSTRTFFLARRDHTEHISR